MVLLFKKGWWSVNLHERLAALALHHVGEGLDADLLLAAQLLHHPPHQAPALGQGGVRQGRTGKTPCTREVPAMGQGVVREVTILCLGF